MKGIEVRIDPDKDGVGEVLIGTWYLAATIETRRRPKKRSRTTAGFARGDPAASIAKAISILSDGLNVIVLPSGKTFT
jgi:hypothetical protein